MTLADSPDKASVAGFYKSGWIIVNAGQIALAVSKEG